MHTRAVALPDSPICSDVHVRFAAIWDAVVCRLDAPHVDPFLLASLCSDSGRVELVST